MRYVLFYMFVTNVFLFTSLDSRTSEQITKDAFTTENNEESTKNIWESYEEYAAALRQKEAELNRTGQTTEDIFAIKETEDPMKRFIDSYEDYIARIGNKSTTQDPILMQTTEDIFMIKETQDPMKKFVDSYEDYIASIGNKSTTLDPILNQTTEDIFFIKKTEDPMKKFVESYEDYIAHIGNKTDIQNQTIKQEQDNTTKNIWESYEDYAAKVRAKETIITTTLDSFEGIMQKLRAQEEISKKDNTSFFKERSTGEISEESTTPETEETSDDYSEDEEDDDEDEGEDENKDKDDSDPVSGDLFKMSFSRTTAGPVDYVKCKCVCATYSPICRTDDANSCLQECLRRCDLNVHTVDEYGQCIDKANCTCMMQSEYEPICVQDLISKKEVEMYNLREYHCDNICHNNKFSFLHHGECPCRSNIYDLSKKYTS